MNVLCELPEEILQETLCYVDQSGLLNLALSCRWAYNKAIPLIWKDIELVDCRTRRSEYHDASDEHDDAPIIRKLLTLSSNTWIASHVHTLTHRCHLPPPAIFHEVPHINFQGRSLSSDPRTLWLLERACSNLSNLHTLRIVFGHWNLTRGLLIGLLGSSRRSQIRHLWLENCSIAGITAETLQGFDLVGLESLRLRRLPVLPQVGCYDVQEVYYRSAPYQWLQGTDLEYYQDGQGREYTTTTHLSAFQEGSEQYMLDYGRADSVLPLNPRSLRFLLEESDLPDKEIYEQLTDESNDMLMSFLRELSDERSSAVRIVNEAFSLATRSTRITDTNPFPTFEALIKRSASTLTSLNLDWLLIQRTDRQAHPHDTESPCTLFKDLFKLRFPCLRAFQLRNTVVSESELPPHLYLLDACGLDATTPADLSISFMEAHPRLQCLAWPISRFFSSNRNTLPRLQSRVDNIIDKLASGLTDLRVDAFYDRCGEFQTDNSTDILTSSRRICRRRFISEFAARMRKLECFKIEGGIPRDERRETLRALHQCPLQKVVLIGVNCPIGNTWGFCGRDIGSLGINEDPNDPDDFGSLEAEAAEELTRFSVTDPEAHDSRQPFEAQYGWPPSAPLMHTLAAYHASTVTELKFCGYRGAPLLWNPTTITSPMLSPLRHFHNLRHLILSLWLHTIYESEHRDDNILDYWLNTRNPSSTALVTVSSEEPTGWQKELADKYDPSRIAARIVTLMSPFLSERAKARPGGLHVRASFCIGTSGGLFDFDVTIGKAADGSDELKSWKGPREELHPERRVDKLQQRRWFGGR